MNPKAILIEVSPGELWDKITILRLKARHMRDDAMLRHVHAELSMLESAAAPTVSSSPELEGFVTELAQINAELWDIEDNIRRCEAQQDFGEHFMSLARSVYLTNDRRSRVKRQINELLGAAFSEQKQHPAY